MTGVREARKRIVAPLALAFAVSLGINGQQRPPWACSFQTHMSAAKVTGKPFSAEYRIIANAGRSDAIVLQSGRIYRDAAGSIRNECQARLEGEGDENHVIAFIQIEPDGRLIVLDTTSRRVLADSGPVSSLLGDASGRSHQDQAGWFFYGGEPEFLKDRVTIGNETCRLVRLKPVQHGRGSAKTEDSPKEVCWSDELQVPLTDRFMDEGRPHEYSLSNIKRLSPPSSLFSIPTGFGSVPPR
jgi:hypothetical protein